MRARVLISKHVGLTFLLLVTACDVGGGGGGGPTGSPLPSPPPFERRIESDPVLRGATLYHDLGCRLCHGEGGKGGVANPNNNTGGKIAGLTLVKEGYSKAELVEKIRKGAAEVKSRDPAQAIPPLRMPAYGRWMGDARLSDVADYLLSLYPKDRSSGDDWDDEESEGEGP